VIPEPRPSGGAYPLFASGISGAAAITQPPANDLALGWQAGDQVRAEYFNFLQNLTGSWIKHIDETRDLGDFGDASDGNLTVGATEYVMTRHLMIGDLVVGGQSSVLNTNGWIPFVRGVFTGQSGVIRANGGYGGTGMSLPAGVNQPLAGIPSFGPLRGGIGSGTGVTEILGPLGRIAWGEGRINSLGGNGGLGGSGFASGGAQPGLVAAPTGFWRKAPQAIDGFVHWLAAPQTGGSGGAPQGVTSAYLTGGGGGGMGGGAIAGNVCPGGGGAGGALVLIPARWVNWIGRVEVKGGDGGSVVAPSVGPTGPTGMGGGGGGGGGAAVFTYKVKQQLSVSLDARGGRGGSGNPSGGMAGSVGQTGPTAIIEIQL
jgi:hypothetical protein